MVMGSPATKVVQRITALFVRSATYQPLDSVPFQEYAISKREFWGQRSLYYWISFLCNSLLVLCGLSGYVISADRDSSHEPKNCARFTIVAVYTVPTMLVTGLLVSSSYNLHRKTRKLLGEARTHMKLALFGAAMNALAFLFMDIYALVLDNPESRFGTKNDIRNTLLHLIIIFASVSTISLLISAWITFSQKQMLDFELPSTAPAQEVWSDIEERPSFSESGEHSSIKSP